MTRSDVPPCHRCAAPAVFQWARSATVAEADIQRREIAVMQGRTLGDAEIAAKYGPLRTAVAGCVVHHLGGDSDDPDSGLGRRALLHDADCGGHGRCGCAAVA